MFPTVQQKPLPFGERSYIRREVLTLPNAVTAVRVVCALMMFATGEPLLVFWLALVGGVSDLIDGYLAKRFKLGTKFGKHFDQYTDWLFGVALLYAIYRYDGMSLLAWPYNWELLFLIGGYLLLRVWYPTVETIWIAKVKTAMQFCGGVGILGGYAHVCESFVAGSSAAVINVGYLVVWTSIALMWVTYGYYRKIAKG